MLSAQANEEHRQQTDDASGMVHILCGVVEYRSGGPNLA